jgi:hypothetical protein
MQGKASKNNCLIENVQVEVSDTTMFNLYSQPGQ